MDDVVPVDGGPVRYMPTGCGLIQRTTISSDYSIAVTAAPLNTLV